MNNKTFNIIRTIGEIADKTCDTPKEEVIEIVKCMMFGKQAFERFSKDEREALCYCLNILEKE